MAGSDWPRVAWNNALTYDMIFTGPVVNELDELAMPTYLLIGTRDRTGPGRHWKKTGINYQLGQYQKLGKAAAYAIPDGHLIEMPGIGHMPQFEAFERYRANLQKIMESSVDEVAISINF